MDSAVTRGLLVCIVVLVGVIAALVAGLVGIWGQATRSQVVAGSGVAFVATVSTVAVLLNIAGVLGNAG